MWRGTSASRTRDRADTEKGRIKGFPEAVLWVSGSVVLPTEEEEEPVWERMTSVLDHLNLR